MDTAVRDAVERVVSLADVHAADFIGCMSQARTQSELQTALSGSFLAFLAEALLVNSNGS